MYRIELMQRPERASGAILKLRALVAEYYITTEEFDRRLPGAWHDRDPETWMPLDRSTSNRFAREEWSRMLTSAAAIGLLPGVLREQIEAAKEELSGRRLSHLRDVVSAGKPATAESETE